MTRELLEVMGKAQVLLGWLGRRMCYAPPGELEHIGHALRQLGAAIFELGDRVSDAARHAERS